MKKIYSVLTVALVILLAVCFSGCAAIPFLSMPTEAPTDAPTEEATEAPTEEPTEEPTEAPTEAPEDEGYPVNKTFTWDGVEFKIVSLKEGGQEAVDSNGEPDGRWVVMELDIVDGKMLYDDYSQHINYDLGLDGHSFSNVTLPIDSFEIDGSTYYIVGSAELYYDVNADTALEDLDIIIK